MRNIIYDSDIIKNFYDETRQKIKENTVTKKNFKSQQKKINKAIRTAVSLGSSSVIIVFYQPTKETDIIYDLIHNIVDKGYEIHQQIISTFDTTKFIFTISWD